MPQLWPAKLNNSCTCIYCYLANIRMNYRGIGTYVAVESTRYHNQNRKDDNAQRDVALMPAAKGYHRRAKLQTANAKRATKKENTK